MLTDLSFNDIQSLLTNSLSAESPAGSDTYFWVRDVYSTYAVYKDEASGKLVKRGYIINADKTVTWGEPIEVVQQTSYEPVVQTSAFSLTGQAQFSQAGDVVLRRGKIFQAGDYPEVGYSMTAEELAAAASSFKPVPLDLEHMPTVLDGKLGTLQSVEMGEDGTSLFGTVALPKWLDSLLDDATRKVSCTWDRATKRLAGLAMTRTPRIDDAALFGAFVEFKGQRHSAADLKDIQAVHDLTVKQGATCAATYSAIGNQANKETKKMPTLFERIANAFSGATPEELAQFSAGEGAASQPPAATTTTATNVPPPAATPPQPPSAEVLALMSQVETLNKRNREQVATAEIEAQILAGKIHPALKQLEIADFAQAMADDEKDPQLVTFSDGKGGTVQLNRVQRIKARYAATPSNGLTTEHVAVAFALPNGDTSQQEDPAERGRKQGKKYVEENYPATGGK